MSPADRSYLGDLRDMRAWSANDSQKPALDWAIATLTRQSGGSEPQSLRDLWQADHDLVDQIREIVGLKNKPGSLIDRVRELVSPPGGSERLREWHDFRLHYSSCNEDYQDTELAEQRSIVLDQMAAAIFASPQGAEQRQEECPACHKAWTEHRSGYSASRCKRKATPHPEPAATQGLDSSKPANAEPWLEEWPAACNWPNKPFTVVDGLGEHDPCWLIFPGGEMLALNHHATNGVDQARAQFIADACNFALNEKARIRRMVEVPALSSPPGVQAAQVSDAEVERVCKLVAIERWPDSYDADEQKQMRRMVRITMEHTFAQPSSAAHGGEDDVREAWFMCHHPAWPDPYPAGNNTAAALATLRKYPHPDAWLLRTLVGGRVEYRGNDLAILVARNGGLNEA